MSNVHKDEGSTHLCFEGEQQAMTDILSRLSAAAGPSRELDAEIALANGWTHNIYDRPTFKDPSGQPHALPPRYTESIDAALTLVLERAGWKLASWFKDGYAADIHLPNGVITRGEGTTPAIALVIACLKAKDGKP